jgi:hypothetical protein
LKLTITHFAVKAVAEMIASAPDLNGKVVFGRVIAMLFSGFLMKLSILASQSTSIKGMI